MNKINKTLIISTALATFSFSSLFSQNPAEVKQIKQGEKVTIKLQKGQNKVDPKNPAFKNIPMTGKFSKEIILDSPEAFDKLIALIDGRIKELDKEIKAAEKRCEGENFIQRPFCEINRVQNLRERIIGLSKQKQKVLNEKNKFIKNIAAKK